MDRWRERACRGMDGAGVIETDPIDQVSPIPKPLIRNQKFTKRFHPLGIGSGIIMVRTGISPSILPGTPSRSIANSISSISSKLVPSGLRAHFISSSGRETHQGKPRLDLDSRWTRHAQRRAGTGWFYRGKTWEYSKASYIMIVHDRDE